MNTNVENAEVQRNTCEKMQAEEQYRIFDYFKEHTGLLVTCISAMVAIMSFILHFAVARMNYAYLEYWGIAPLYANINNQNELYTVVCSMVYCLALMIIHGLLSKMSDAFRYYNKLLSTMYQAINADKKRNRHLRKELRGLRKELGALPQREKRSKGIKRIKRKIKGAKEELDEFENSIQTLKKSRHALWKWVVIQIIIAIVASYFMGMMSLVLVDSTLTIDESLRSTWTILVIIGLDLLLYFLPAYFATRCSKKQYEENKSVEGLLKLLDSKIPNFPFEDIRKKGLKSMFSDSKLKLAVGQVIVVTIILLISISIAGTTNAAQNKCFQIYRDESGTYAIVYTTSSSIYMEEATMQDGTLIIDASKQRIITSDDISFSVEKFDDVLVINNADDDD